MGLIENESRDFFYIVLLVLYLVGSGLFYMDVTKVKDITAQQPEALSCDMHSCHIHNMTVWNFLNGTSFYYLVALLGIPLTLFNKFSKADWAEDVSLFGYILLIGGLLV